MPAPLLANLGAPELLIIAAVLVLLFGASKLPDLARGSGRALRIFKAETRGLLDDDDDDDATKTPAQRDVEARNLQARPIDADDLDAREARVRDLEARERRAAERNTTD